MIIGTFVNQRLSGSPGKEVTLSLFVFVCWAPGLMSVSSAKTLEGRPDSSPRMSPSWRQIRKLMVLVTSTIVPVV